MVENASLRFLVISQSSTVNTFFTVCAYPRTLIGRQQRLFILIEVGIFASQAHDDWLQWTAEGGLPFGIMLTTL